MYIFSYGGGVQSTAAMVLAVQKRIPYRIFVFSNVGDDSEHPDTLRYIADVARPYAEANDLTFVEVHRVVHGKPTTLYEQIQRSDARAIDIPVRSAATGAPMRRQCTKHFKIKAIGKYTKQAGATVDCPAYIGLGISIDEYQRVNTNSLVPWHINDYPLIDLRFSRADCVAIIERAGLPVPPKSACWFCPFTRMTEWARMKQENPNLFMNAVVLEYDIRAKRRAIGQTDVFLTRAGRALADVVGDQSLIAFDDDDMCESGHCMT